MPLYQLYSLCIPRLLRHRRRHRLLRRPAKTRLTLVCPASRWLLVSLCCQYSRNFNFGFYFGLVFSFSLPQWNERQTQSRLIYLFTLFITIASWTWSWPPSPHDTSSLWSLPRQIWLKRRISVHLFLETFNTLLPWVVLLSFKFAQTWEGFVFFIGN